MERLALDDGASYSALESAIHVSRYAIAKSACAGRRVLDVACGEGYGSALLSRWGAEYVDALDVSSDAIAAAKRLFPLRNVNFQTGRAEQLETIYGPNSFDLIVSFETVEHVEDPVAFLRALNRILKPGGAIMISCPNDYWYYPEDNQFNPNHRRKYRFEEFRSFAETLLGPGLWYVGSLAAGYMATSLSERLIGDGGQLAMMLCEAAPDAIIVPSDREFAPVPGESAYFVGIWGSPALERSLAVAATSLGALGAGVFAGSDAVALREQAGALEARLFAQSEELANEREVARVENSALSAEAATLRTSLSGAAAERRRLESALEEMAASLAAATERESERERHLRRSRLSAAATAAENRLMRDSVCRLEHEQSGMLRQLRETEERFEALKAQYSDLQHHADELTDRRDYLDRYVQDLEQERGVTLRTQRETAEDFEAFKARYSDLQHHVEGLQRRCDDLVKRDIELQKRHDDVVSNSEGLLQQYREVEQRSHSLHAVLDTVPWRAVAVYRKLRRYAPKLVLRLGARVVDGVALRKRGLSDGR